MGVRERLRARRAWRRVEECGGGLAGELVVLVRVGFVDRDRRVDKLAEAGQGFGAGFGGDEPGAIGRELLEC